MPPIRTFSEYISPSLNPFLKNLLMLEVDSFVRSGCKLHLTRYSLLSGEFEYARETMYLM